MNPNRRWCFRARLSGGAFSRLPGRRAQTLGRSSGTRQLRNLCKDAIDIPHLHCEHQGGFHCKVVSASSISSYLVDPASSHMLVLKIKPCMSKCFVFITLDCGRLIITVIVFLRLLYRWIPVVILELIHVTKNIFFYILSICLSSNQNALALWMIHRNFWRTL